MKISFGTRIGVYSTVNGYGYATDRMLDSLTKLGYEINNNDPTADAEIWFDQPHHWKWRDSQYKIGYHPWESTQLKKGWVSLLNNCDEVWTPSKLIGDWYAADGVLRPIHIYPHGVDPCWIPTKRKVEDKLRFLHVGGEAARKGGLDTLRAFRLAFQNRDDVELTMKMINSGWHLREFGKVRIINDTLSLDELVQLYQAHHVFVYPSMGEGFGLTPLQALATGMPTITVPAWAPYAHFLDERLCLGSELKTSPWKDNIHPGKMFRVSFDDLVDRLRFAADNYEELHSYGLNQTAQIQSEYDWLDLTKCAFESLQERLEKK